MTSSSSLGVSAVARPDSSTQVALIAEILCLVECAPTVVDNNSPHPWNFLLYTGER